MKFSKKVIGGLVGAAMMLPLASVASTLSPVGNLNLTLNGPTQSFGGVLDTNGEAAWGLTVNNTGNAGASAVSLQYTFPSYFPTLYLLGLSLFEDTNTNGLLDTGTDNLIASTGLSYVPILTANGLSGGVQYFLGLTGTAGKSYSGEANAVPLPAAALLFGSALLGAGALGRKRNAEKGEAIAA